MFCSKIVVPYDHSEMSKKALEKAIILAKQDEKIELDVITAVDVHSTIYYYGAQDPVREIQISKAKEVLAEVEQKIKDLPNDTKTVLIEGRPASAIVDYTKDVNADLIIMGSRGLNAIQEAFLGSVSHHVVQKSACPVFIVK